MRFSGGKFWPFVGPSLRAASTRSVLFSICKPFNAAIAFAASDGFANSTNPYPFDEPDGCSCERDQTQNTQNHTASNLSG